MSSVPTTGVCILSIDVPNCVRGSGVERFDPFLIDLCGQLAAAKLPATWSFCEPPGDKLRQALDEHRGCESALLAEASWAAEGVNRSRFWRGLADSLGVLGSVGLTPTTLCLSHGRLAPHDDLLVRHGVRAVRLAARREQALRVQRWWRQRESTARAIRPIRWGLWEVAVNVDLSVVGLGGVARMLDRISRQTGVAVVTADVTMLEREAKRLSRFVEHLKRRRDEKSLSIETVAASVSRQQVPRQRPARSILRTAAA
jgi:hypothetical protein